MTFCVLILIDTLFLWIFTSFQRRSDAGSKEFLFLVRISPSRKHPKKAKLQIHQKVFEINLLLKKERVLFFNSCRRWNVMALRVLGFLLW